MRKLLLAAAALMLAQPAHAAVLPADLAKAAHDYDQAQIKGDKAELGRLLADDYVLQNSGGQVQDKASFIADFTDSTMEPFTVQEPQEKVLVDVALLGGLVDAKGTSGGKAYSARIRFMDVWAKRDGRWQVVFTQATRAPVS